LLVVRRIFFRKRLSNVPITSLGFTRPHQYLRIRVRTSA